MRSRHACAVLLEYAVTARLVYRPVIDVRLMRPLLLAPLVLETNAPLAVYRQSHVCTNLLLVKPTAPVIAIYHLLTSIASYTKRHQLSPVSFAFFHILIISCQECRFLSDLSELYKKLQKIFVQILVTPLPAHHLVYILHSISANQRFLSMTAC